MRYSLWCCTAIFFCASPEAIAHDFFTGFRDPISNAQCCTGDPNDDTKGDCRTALPGEITQVADGWLHNPTGKKLPFGSELPSPNEATYICVYQGNFRCIFRPKPGA